MTKQSTEGCPFGKSAADWANMALDALGRAGMEYNSRLNVRLILEGWLELDCHGDFVMTACPACKFSHGPNTTHIVDQQQVCRTCHTLILAS